MRIPSLILIMFFAIGVFSQEDIKSSGVKTFSISKKENVKETEKTIVPDESKKESNENGITNEKGSGKELFLISKKDETAPEITIVNPVISEGITVTVNSMKLLVTGKVKDESGILTVLVNNSEAIVNAEGSFQAEVLLAFGENIVQVKAIDIHKNFGLTTFMIERKTGEIQPLVVETNSTEIKLPVKSDLIKVEWKMMGSSPFKTASENYNLTACVNTPEAIKMVSLYQNSKLISQLQHKEITFRGECKFNVNEQVNLEKGRNSFKIYVETADAFNESEIEIVFDLFNSKYFALLIGVQDYTDEGITDLTEPVGDANQFAEILKTSYTFEKENIILLENPTKSDIIGTLHNLRKKITEDDNLLIFYAGHGYWDEEMQLGYWLPSDAEKDNPVNWLPNTDLTNYLSAIKSKHTLLVADACFSGGIFKTRSAFGNNMAMEKLFQLKSRKAMTSGTLTEVPDKSVFVEYLFKRLQENTSNYTTSEMLFSELRMAVINNSSNIPQFGTIHNTGDEGGDFIFIKKQ